MKTVRGAANSANDADSGLAVRQLRRKALDYYSDALEAWMTTGNLQLPKVLLIGHSLGIPPVSFLDIMTLSDPAAQQ